MQNYREYVRAFSDTIAQGRELPMGQAAPLQLPPLAPDAPRALIFSPHPDDECIIGGLALRLRRESGFRIINVAVTQGSKQSRQAARLEELRAACNYLGFDLLQCGPNGLESVNEPARKADPGAWAAKVAVIRQILEETKPSAIFFPHEADWNVTHIGVHRLILEALTELKPTRPIHTIETEFWGQMLTPNLMVESTADDVAALVTATSFHIGEVQRNPYHLLLPPWMLDNVRRGTELVGGQGAASTGFEYATLYRHRRWGDSAWEPPANPAFLSAGQNPATLL